MNERIENLLIQCEYQNYGWDGTLIETGWDAEKFAKLIASDIADLCASIEGGENDFSRAIRKEYGIESC